MLKVETGSKREAGTPRRPRASWGTRRVLQRLRAMMDKRGIARPALAEAAGITDTQLGRIFALVHEPRAETLQRLVDAAERLASRSRRGTGRVSLSSGRSS